MSDLAATNCGCDCGGNEASWSGCNSSNWIWIILLLSCCGNNGCGRSGDGCGCNNMWLIIILLLFCCGDNNNGCGCF